jgi:hypothetical protein
MNEFSKEQAYEMVQQALALCTVENAVHSAVVLVVNNEKETVKVYGLNMDESEVPMLLLEAAASVSEKFIDELNRRTLN